MNKALLYSSALSVYVFSSAHAVISLGGSTSEWTAIEYANQSDYYIDQQTGHAASDIVGSPDGTQAGVYKKYEDGGAGLANDYLGFRVRMAAPDIGGGGASWDANLLVGLDVGADGDVDLFIITTQKSGGYIRYYDPGTGANTSPSTTSAFLLNPGTAGYVWEQTPTAPYFDYSPVNSTTDHYFAANGVSDNLDGASTSKDDTDHFISFQVDMWTLAEAVRLATADQADGSGEEILGEDTVMSFLVGTSIQDNAFNQDLNGHDANTDGDPYSNANKDFTWGQLGASSVAYTASGDSPVPEPSSYALLFGLAAVCFVGQRRKR